MSKRAKASLVTLGIALGSALLGWLQTEYGEDLGLCPTPVPAVVFPAEDAGAP